MLKIVCKMVMFFTHFKFHNSALNLKLLYHQMNKKIKLAWINFITDKITTCNKIQ